MENENALSLLNDALKARHRFIILRKLTLTYNNYMFIKISDE